MSKSKIIVLILVLVLLLIYSPISKSFNGSSKTTQLSRTSLKSVTTRVSQPAGMKSGEVAGINTHQDVGSPQSSNSVQSPLQTNISIQNSSLGDSAFDTQTNQLLVLDHANNTIAVIGNNGTIHYMWSLGDYPWAIIFDPLNNLTYIANLASNNVAVFDEYGAIASIRTGNAPVDMALNSRNKMIYVSNEGSGNITVINGTSVYSTITVDTLPQLYYQSQYFPEKNSPTSLAFDSENGYIYAFDNFRSSIVVISGEKIINEISTSARTDYYYYFYSPVSLLFDSYNGYTYLTNPTNGTINVLSNNRVVHSIHLSAFPGYMAFNPNDGYVYAMDPSGSIYLVNGLNITKTLIVGPLPVSGTYDPFNGLFYIVSQNPGNITVVNTTQSSFYSVTLRESGLPVGTSWTAHFAGLFNQSSSSEINFSLTNGLYPFSIPLVTGSNGSAFEAVNLTGTSAVENSSLVLAVNFSTVILHQINVKESGLPAGYTWWLNTSLGQTIQETSTVASIEEPNGTLDYLAQTTTRNWFASSGSMNVSANSSLSVNFTQYENKVTVDLLNIVPNLPLPGNFTFYLNMSGNVSFSIPYNNSNQTAYGLFEIPNGTYNYSISGLSGRIRGLIFGTWDVPSNPNSSYIVFVSGYQSTLVAYSLPGDNLELDGYVIPMFDLVFFKESGLPANTPWTLNITTVYGGFRFYSVMNSSTGFNAELFNGTYSYSATASNSNYSVSKGNFTVAFNFTVNKNSYSVTSVSVPIVFKLKEYQLTVIETGLPTRTNWSLSLGNSSYFTNLTTEQLLLPISNYIYRFQNTSSYYATATTGGIYLDNNTSLSVRYLPYAHILGIIHQTGTTVMVNNATVTLLNGYFDEKVPAGHYAIELFTTNGSYFENVTLSPGQSFEVSPPPAPVTTHPQQALFTWTFFVLLAVLIIESVFFPSYLFYRRKKRE